MRRRRAYFCAADLKIPSDVALQNKLKKALKDAGRQEARAPGGKHVLRPYDVGVAPQLHSCSTLFPYSLCSSAALL
jgi:hypothetical protein